MNSELLRTFLEVSKTRHFGQAAESLCLTQSAVSFRIKQLEEIVGVPLFTRERNNILLTPAGERLLPHAENILASWQMALQDVAASETQAIQLALGGTSNLWDTFLQSLLPKLPQHLPGLYLRTDINTPQQLIRALMAGRLDLIVVLDPPQVAELETVEIGKIELVFVCSKKNKTLGDMDEVGHVFVDWGTAFNFQQAKLIQQPSAPILHTAQSHIALEFLLNHGGMALLPKTMITPYLETQKLFAVNATDSVSRNVYAAFPLASNRSAEFRSILNLLMDADLKPSDPRAEW